MAGKNWGSFQHMSVAVAFLSSAVGFDEWLEHKLIIIFQSWQILAWNWMKETLYFSNNCLTAIMILTLIEQNIHKKIVLANFLLPF